MSQVNHCPKLRHFVWVSFDLGVTGDYEGMYTWLGLHEAKECGDSVACFWYEHPGDLLEDMKHDLSDSVQLNGKSRVYVIRLVEGKMRGNFIVGLRRNAPWVGFAETGEPAEDTSA